METCGPWPCPCAHPSGSTTDIRLLENPLPGHMPPCHLSFRQRDERLLPLRHARLTNEHASSIAAPHVAHLSLHGAAALIARTRTARADRRPSSLPPPSQPRWPRRGALQSHSSRSPPRPPRSFRTDVRTETSHAPPGSPSSPRPPGPSRTSTGRRFRRSTRRTPSIN